MARKVRQASSTPIWVWLLIAVVLAAGASAVIHNLAQTPARQPAQLGQPSESTTLPPGQSDRPAAQPEQRSDSATLAPAQNTSPIHGSAESEASAGGWAGKVVGVHDGDTISVMHGGRAEKIRLQGIDCPESGQDFGRKAKQFTSEMVFGKEVQVKASDVDRYGRTVAEVYTADGKSLNRALVAAGLAWWYRKYAPNDRTLAGLEAQAQRKGTGLWSYRNPTPPWEWRHPTSARSTRPAPTASARPAPAPSASRAGPFVGSRNSDVYHYPDCPQARRIKASNLVTYSSSEEARAKGKRPCKVCCPP